MYTSISKLLTKYFPLGRLYYDCQQLYNPLKIYLQLKFQIYHSVVFYCDYKTIKNCANSKYVTILKFSIIMNAIHTIRDGIHNSTWWFIQCLSE